VDDSLACRDIFCVVFELIEEVLADFDRKKLGSGLSALRSELGFAGCPKSGSGESDRAGCEFGGAT